MNTISAPTNHFAAAPEHVLDDALSQHGSQRTSRVHAFQDGSAEESSLVAGCFARLA